MRSVLKPFVLAFVAGGTAGLLAQAPKQPPPDTAPRKDWADPATIEKRRLDAEKLPLFNGTDPLAVTIVADFKAIQNDRDPDSAKTFPATIQFAANDGSPRSVDLQVRTRGHSRRSFNTCDFAPLRIEFPKDQMKGSVFAGQNALKLGVHCREGVKEFEQYVLREYAAYRIYNLLTPQSFRARLARVSYVDAVKQKPISTHFGLFIEDDDDVARRLGGRITERKEDLAGLDRDAFTRVALFEYLIGNVDMSVIAFHNIKEVQTPSGVVYPVPYDFDYSGLVNATYAAPAAGLGITSVRDRVFRGPCRTETELGSFLDGFRAIRPNIAAVYGSLPEFFDDANRKKALGYLDGFYKTTETPAAIKRAFLEKCLKRGLM
jgi:hypothetical protein